MKLLLFSDNHRNRENIHMMINQEQDNDRIISLGDSEMTEVELSSLGIIGVRGNYPFEPSFPNDLYFDFDGWKFLFTHGHLYSVKMGISRIYEYGMSKQADFICFGHTHIPYLSDLSDTVLINPGSLALPKGKNDPTYVRIFTSPKECRIEMVDLYSNTVVEKIKKTRR